VRIVDVCAFYSPHGGGVRTYVEQKRARAAECGHELVLIVPGARDAVEHAACGARIVHIASPKLPLDRRYRYFAEAAPVHAALDRIAPDIVEASSPWRTASIVANWPSDVPRALVMHADPMASYAYRWFGRVAARATIDRHFEWFWSHLRRTARGHDLVVAANNQLARRLGEGGVRGSAGIVTIPMGTEPDLFSPNRRDLALRRQLIASCGLPEEATLLLGIGRHSPEKRWPTVIDAARIAGVARPIALVLIGDGPDHKKVVRRAGGNPHVRFLAPIRNRERLATILASADALIHGCESETFGMVAAEAAASGLPLIVPDEGGARDLAAPDRAEYYRAGDARAGAAAIARLLSRNQLRLRHAAARAAAQVPTMEGHFDALFDRYAALAAARGDMRLRA